jgi:hypothetical protein
VGVGVGGALGAAGLHAAIANDTTNAGRQSTPEHTSPAGAIQTRL